MQGMKYTVSQNTHLDYDYHNNHIILLPPFDFNVDEFHQQTLNSAQSSSDRNSTGPALAMHTSCIQSYVPCLTFEQILILFLYLTIGFQI